MKRIDKKIKKYYDLLEHKIVNPDNYYSKELKPLLNGKNLKIKIINSDYTTKWLDVNLDSVGNLTTFINTVKTDLEREI